jgi:maltooligosyltrehalose trehalohydrolase
VKSLELVIEGGDSLPVPRGEDGYGELTLPGAGVGTRYRYRVEGNGPFPDPASRYQPEGVHGASEVIDPRTFAWTDQDWNNLPYESLVFYELHVGTFSPEGTFAGVEARLPLLKELGVNAIELMPVGDFPGRWNWGYDGVSLFAPARCYGRPDDLRRLVDTAHRLGLAVILDVVYNHFGPDGNYTGLYSPYYLSKKHHTPWGDAINLDGPHSENVRGFFIENALHWVHEYHIDGLRLDATHALMDDGPRHFLAELTARVKASVAKPVHVVAEDHRNLAHMMKPEAGGGWGLDGVWADDLHHQMRRMLAGDHEGYYADYRGTVGDLAKTVEQGWYYCGQPSGHLNEVRGTDPAGLSPRAFVVCLQNHDQIGNRAFGERLNHEIDPAAWRAASTLLLTLPQTPLVFMGQEWATSSPFRFFTDYEGELGRLVTEGRRREFRHFSAFSDPKKRQSIPDPQSPATFEASRLPWDEREREPHAGCWRLYQELLRLRQTEPALRQAKPGSYRVWGVGASATVLYRRFPSDNALLVVCKWRGGGKVRVGDLPATADPQLVLSTEDERFCDDPKPITMKFERYADGIRFQRPGAVILRVASPIPAELLERLTQEGEE